MQKLCGKLQKMQILVKNTSSGKDAITSQPLAERSQDFSCAEINIKPKFSFLSRSVPG